MIVYDPTKGFVNPLQLAISSQSASFKRRSLGLIVPQVVRPELLSDQMRGCGCGMCGADMDGLGQFDPASAAAATQGVATAVTTAKNFYESLLAALGIGAGAREANIITPIQNQITNTVLVPAVNAAENVNVTCADLIAWQRAIQTAHDSFQGWLTNTQWADGRAAQQALAWLNGPLPASASQPSWFHQVQSDLNNTISQKCGSSFGGTIVTLPGGVTVGSNVLLAVAAIGAFFLLKK